ncbi:MerR family DNA-binding transcriptional regulator [Streptomyces sp. NPDC053560]|uniref:helix-turn-helix domain-containing protein n=1 Tax=Streptomyces sp. NPDC053560 TaxID=3365711 RepID=UPI0037D8788B
MTTTMTLTPAEAARAAGVPLSTLRYYERRGFLAPARDPHSGYRRFSRRSRAWPTVRRRATARVLSKQRWPIWERMQGPPHSGRRTPQRSAYVAERDASGHRLPLATCRLSFATCRLLLPSCCCRPFTRCGGCRADGTAAEWRAETAQALEPGWA